MLFMGQEPFTLAFLLLKTLESNATSCLVKALGGFRVPPQLDITICDFKISNSNSVNWNINISGSRSIFLFTVWFKALVSTWLFLKYSEY